MKKLILAVIISSVLPLVSLAAYPAGAKCGDVLDDGTIVQCGNGPILRTTEWVICQVNGDLSKADGYTRTNCKTTQSEDEYQRLSWLEVARQILSAPTRSNWKGTIVQAWLERYSKGER